MSNASAVVPSEWLKPWYRWHRFPLIPEFGIRPETKYDVSHFWFHWLALRVWDIASPDIGLSLELTDQDICFGIRLPYLIIRLTIPLFPYQIYQKTWRTKPLPWPGE